ncbi:hypothetical protein, partial [Janthinobacterium sp. HLS12-2]|uniref:hypothetical protein n=1 Tax=Janthinobacterium sp. HLS12-2 TaxID=1259324 RepID=UPI003F217746
MLLFWRLAFWPRSEHLARRQLGCLAHQALQDDVADPSKCSSSTASTAAAVIYPRAAQQGFQADFQFQQRKWLEQIIGIAIHGRIERRPLRLRIGTLLEELKNAKQKQQTKKNPTGFRWGFLLLRITSLTITYFHTGCSTIIGAKLFHGPVR